MEIQEVRPPTVYYSTGTRSSVGPAEYWNNYNPLAVCTISALTSWTATAAGWPDLSRRPQNHCQQMPTWATHVRAAFVLFNLPRINKMQSNSDQAASILNKTFSFNCEDIRGFR